MTDSTFALFSELSPRWAQKRLALSIAILLFVGLVVTAPFFSVQLPRIDAFIPVLDSTLFLLDLITATLLFSQFFVLGARSLLALASGYLFTALIIAIHGLTFPGAFTPAGLLGANLQTTVYIYIIWHFGLPSAAIAYVLLKSDDAGKSVPPASRLRTLVVSILCILLFVFAFTILTTVGAFLLPPMMVDAQRGSRLWGQVAWVIMLYDVAAIVLLWRRSESVLDIWLLVVLWAWLIETILLSMTTYRFNLVWYFGRSYAVLASSFVLIVLLIQITTLYTRLALVALAQRSERENRLLAIDAALSLVAHEMYQPISAIKLNAESGLTLARHPLTGPTPFEDIFRDIANDGERASKIISGIRDMFKSNDAERTQLNIDGLIANTVAFARREIVKNHIVLETIPTRELPHVFGNQIQLQQVLLNLITNAIDAMRSIHTRPRVLCIQAHRDGDNVVVKVEDRGPGIDRNDRERVFDPFFSTKSSGMGLGLSVCRSIVESHGGRLWVSDANPHGAIFQFTVPIFTSTAESQL
jgi:signal transduction histidine kinase